ncbi:MAG: ATP-binding protein [Hyphomonadaceae bacterium]
MPISSAEEPRRDIIFCAFTGGLRAKPGEISLAHHGVLFLDELPEFSQQALDALRQPLESGQVLIARANHHVTYPARILLAAAMNPCRCGGGPGAGRCRRGPRCAIEYQARLSGPLLDRIDIQLDVPPVTAADLALPAPVEGTAEAAQRVGRARDAQLARGAGLNAALNLEALETLAAPDAPGAALLAKAAESLALSARAYHRTLKVARTIADLDGSDAVRRIHVAEALSLKRQWASPDQGGFAKVS